MCVVFMAATQAWEKSMKIPGLPSRLGFTNEIQRNASNIFGICSAAGAINKMSRVTQTNFRSSNRVLLLGFAPFSHSPIKAIERDLPF